MSTFLLYNPLPNGETLLAVPPDIINRDYVHVYIRNHTDGLDQFEFNRGFEVLPGSGFTWLTDGQIQLTSAADGAHDYLVVRETPRPPLVEHQPGLFSSAKANLLSQQEEHIDEEQDDEIAEIDRQFRRTLRVVDGEDPGDFHGIDAAGRAGLIMAFDGAGDSIVIPNESVFDYSFLAGPTGAYLVGYKRPEAGSVLETVGDVLDNVTANVMSFGAVGDGVTDDTVAFQAAANSRRSIIIPKGRYIISSKITFPTSLPGGGVRWTGEGPSYSDAFAIPGVRDGTETVVIWAGADAGTMFELDSMVGFKLTDITLVGRDDLASDSHRAGVGIQMKHSLTPGNGTHTLDRVTFQYIETAIQFGLAIADTNNDTTRFGHVLFYRCHYGFRSRNNQALGFHFESIFATQCATPIKMDRGGSVSFNQANFNQCGNAAVAQTYGGSSTSFAIEIDNTSTGGHDFTFTNLRCESGTHQICKANVYTRITFMNFNHATADGNCREFQLTGGTMVFQSGRFVTQDDTIRAFYLRDGTGGQRSNMVFRDCVFENPQTPVRPFDYLGWFDVSTRGAIIMENCSTGLTNQAVPVLGTKLEWGDVYLRGITTDATARSITNNSSPFATISNSIQLFSNTAWKLDVEFMAMEVDGSGRFTGRYATLHRRCLAINYWDGAAQTTVVNDLETVGVDVDADSLTTAVNISAGANNTLAIDVQGTVAHTLHWYATIKRSMCQPLFYEAALPPIDLQYVSQGNFQDDDGNPSSSAWNLGAGVAADATGLTMDATVVGIAAAQASGFGESASGGISYHVEYDVVAVTAAGGGVSIKFGGTLTPAVTTVGHKTADITAVAEEKAFVIKRGGANFAGTVNNISIVRNP